MLYFQAQVSFTLIVGIVIGFTIAFIILAPQTIYKPHNEYYNKYAEILDGHGHSHQHNRDFHDEEEMNDVEGPSEHVGNHDENDTFHRMTDSRYLVITFIFFADF